MSDAVEAQLRQAIVTIRSLKQQVQALRETGKPAVAVVGMGCRLPAGADSPAALWDMLMAGQDAISEVPADRWDVDAWYDKSPDAIGKMTTRWGGFVRDIDRFDPAFFELSSREAAAMDPQQRMLLEVTWEALEDAAIAPDALSGSATGVFLGINGSDYYQMAMSSPAAIDAYAISGSVASVAAGRLSYLLGLNGPAMAIDTACSSSLTAVHLAMQSLRSGESRVALAGGTYAVLQPNLSVGLSRLQMMAADGRCKSFDAAADGFVQGEGCAMVVLKRLDDAVADGDNIHAVIRGSAINQDGRSSSLTAPSRSAQVSVIRAALADADIPASRIGYIETHGTGTALGDPIELHALADALGRKRERPLVLGALKSNIGHLGPAAGVAGLVKAVLAVKAGVIPPNLHLKQINPAISLDGLPVLFPESPTVWPEGKGLRAAGVSAFGFSGTNVHVVLEAAPLAIKNDPNSLPGGWAVFCPSARSEAALADAVSRLIDALDDSIDLVAASRTSMFGRRAFEFSAVAIAQSPAQARGNLSAAAVVKGVARPRLAMLFGDPRKSGPMDAGGVLRSVRLLGAAFPKMREVFKLAAQTVPSLNGLLEEGNEHPIGPTLIVLQWALSVQLRDWGLTPALCTGQGLGELSAAASAGLLAWPDVLRTVDRCCQQEGNQAQALALLMPCAGPASSILVSGQSGQVVEQVSASYFAGLAEAPLESPALPAGLKALGCTAVLALDASSETFVDASLLVSRVLDNDDPVAALMFALGVLHAHGLKPDWRALLGNGVRANLPLYPFQRNHYWRASPVDRKPESELAGSSWPPGLRVLSPSLDAQFHLQLGIEKQPWLSDHRVHGLPVVPGAFQIACLSAAWEAARPPNKKNVCDITELTFARPLMAPEMGSIELWTLLTPQGDVQLAAQVEDRWLVYAQAKVLANSEGQPDALPLGALRERCSRPVSPAAWRDALAGLGIAIGPAFHGIRNMWEAEDEALAEVALPAGLTAPVTGFHPALFDACLQVAGGALSEHTRSGEAMLPIGIDRLTFYGGLEGPLWVHARCKAKGDVFSTDLIVADPSGDIKAVIQGLHVRRAPLQLLRDDPCLALFHAIEWRPTPLLTAEASLSGSVATRLVVAADAATGQDLLSRLSGNSVLVTAGEQMTQVAATHWQLPLASLDQLMARLPEVTEVVDLQAWSVTRLPSDNDVCRPALETIQALLRVARPPRLWLVTQSAMLDVRNPWQTSLWGLGATLGLEHPHLDCRRLDADSLAAVAAELGAMEMDAKTEYQLAWCEGVRHVARMVQRPPKRSAAPPVRLRDTVLISGGLGGIAREVARWAVSSGAKQLVLTSRSASGPDAEAFAQSLGVPVLLARADLSLREEVEGLLSRLDRLPPLRAIFHTAGVQAEGLLDQISWEKFDVAHGAKLRGAWWLHLCTRGMPLDHFVLFSSIASTLGAAAQGGYASANAGLDGLARHRRVNGLPALSVAWGRWGGVGMVNMIDDKALRRIDALGIAPMAPALALAALEMAMACELTDPMIAVIDWSRYRAQHSSANAQYFLDALDSPVSQNTSNRTWDKASLMSLTSGERATALLDLLTTRFRVVLGLQQGQRLDATRPLVQLGMDSLMAMEVRNQIQRNFGQAPSIGDLLGGASLSEISVGLDASLTLNAKVTDGSPAEVAEQWEEFRI